jgi:voltage-gated potassium channel
VLSEGIERTANRMVERITQNPMRGAWRAAATILLSATIIGGILIRLSDPDEFESVWEGLWWAVQTVTTVGYGDVVPQSVLGRLVGTLVMIVGIAFITVSTAAIASAFVEAGRRQRDLADDPERSELRLLRAEIESLRTEVRTLIDRDGP